MHPEHTHEYKIEHPVKHIAAIKRAGVQYFQEKTLNFIFGLFDLLEQELYPELYPSNFEFTVAECLNPLRAVRCPQ